MFKPISRKYCKMYESKIYYYKDIFEAMVSQAFIILKIRKINMMDKTSPSKFSNNTCGLGYPHNHTFLTPSFLTSA